MGLVDAEDDHVSGRARAAARAARSSVAAHHEGQRPELGEAGQRLADGVEAVRPACPSTSTSTSPTFSPAAVRAAPRDHRADGGRTGRGPSAADLGLGLGVAQEEPVLKGHPLGHDGLGHRREPHLDGAAASLARQHRERHRLADAGGGDEALERARVDDRPVLEGHDQVARS